MRLVNEKTNESHAVRVHGKKPAYFDGSDRRRKVTLNGKEVEFVLHPKRESSDRVNFAGPKDVWYFVDDAALRDLIAAKSTAKLSFVTAEGRAPKAPKPEDKATAATEAATAKA